MALKVSDLVRGGVGGWILKDDLQVEALHGGKVPEFVRNATSATGILMGSGGRRCK